VTGRLGPSQLEDVARLGTATIAEVAGPGLRILDRGLCPLWPEAKRVAGHAFTVQCKPGDNLAIHLTLSLLEPGDFLVVDYGGSTETGPFGEIMALASQTRGARGLVIDGAVRDRSEIKAMGFPVWCRGVAIPGTTKTDRGNIGKGCRIAGTEVRQGDLVVADGDAVVVLDPRDVPDVVTNGRARLEREAAIMDRLRAGETTCEIFGLA
jgi:4-hydroxy-4-methyl-2-oxoglutarate aldolase